MKTKQRNVKRGFSLVDLLLIAAAVLLVIFIVMWPKFRRARGGTQRINCANNLKQVSIAFRGWSFDKSDQFSNSFPMQVSMTDGGLKEIADTGSAYALFIAMSNDLVTPKILFCPNESNTNRTNAAIWSLASSQYGLIDQSVPFGANTFSYFAGLDADQSNPNTILTGDDNFTVNNQRPNPGLLLLDTNSPTAWTTNRHKNWGNVGFADGSVQSLTTPAFRVALAQTGLATNRLAMP